MLVNQTFWKSVEGKCCHLKGGNKDSFGKIKFKIQRSSFAKSVGWEALNYNIIFSLICFSQGDANDGGHTGWLSKKTYQKD